MAISNDGNIVKRTSQYIDNESFNETTGLRVTEIGGTDGAQVNTAKVNADGSLKVSPGLNPGTDFDYIDGQQTSPTVDTYVYKLGGAGGTTVRTVTVTYTSSAKTDIDNVVYS